MFFSSQKSIEAMTSLAATPGVVDGMAKMKLSSVFKSWDSAIGRLVDRDTFHKFKIEAPDLLISLQ